MSHPVVGVICKHLHAMREARAVGNDFAGGAAVFGNPAIVGEDQVVPELEKTGLQRCRAEQVAVDNQNIGFFVFNANEIINPA